MRKTKIICTLGPSTDKEGILEKLVLAGMNTARMNFSHSSYDDHKRRLEEIKELRKKYNKHISVLLDTKGPEIRLKDFEGGKVYLETGSIFRLTTDEILGTAQRASITYKNLKADVKIGKIISIDDGLIELVIKDIEENDIVCEVINGGYVSNHKGINVPGVILSMPYISDKDKADNVYKGIRPLTGDDIAEVVYFAASAPEYMQIAEVLVMPTNQATGTITYKNN